jgi:hypothetical protein
MKKDCRTGHIIIWYCTNGKIKVFECKKCKKRFRQINNSEEQIR